MKTLNSKTDAVAMLQKLTLTEVEERLDELDAQRAALSLLRRSLAARERVRRRAARRSSSQKEVEHGR
jgi:hypothetical protein